MIWMISAKSKIYDYVSAFATFGFIDWKQRAKYKIGDTVFIYCATPCKKVRYKCEVIKCNMQFSECVDDSAFWKDADMYNLSKGGKFARLKLITQADSPYLTLERLRENGLANAPQGPLKVSAQLSAYLEEHFDDYYSDGFFTDVENDAQYNEGHVKK